ncbi:MAG TPA: hypothetical protein VGB73_16535 [Pyrinomonadaceae bacterium]|jgi:hypothetical protein
MRRFLKGIRAAAALVLLASVGASGAWAQKAATRQDEDSRGYSESVGKGRQRDASRDKTVETDAVSILRAARTIYIEPSERIDSKYLEYKLGKHPEFQQWKLSIVKDRDKADLVLSVHQRMLNYIFSIEDPETSIVVVNGKVVAINDLVAAEDISKEIIRRMKNTRALAVD